MIGIFEALMLICFGISWPIAAYKTYRMKRVEGKSLTFSFLILLGYIFGIIHKIFFNCDWVLCIYVLNTIFVLLDIGLHLRYKKSYTAI